MLYVDTSALLKRYVEEPESAETDRILAADLDWITARHTRIEARRNLSRLLQGAQLQNAFDAFEDDWQQLHVVELDFRTCERAAEIAETTLARTLDALHLAAAMRVGGDIRLFTYDLRQARAGRALGLPVVGN